MKSPLENFCPVPREQRPFYQYLRHKEFFSGESLGNKTFLLKNLLKTSLKFLIFSITSFIIFFLPETLSYKNILEILILNFSLMLVFYVYVLINHMLVSNQLFKSKVLYEESTWFDINTWVKPVTSIRHERLINEYQILPKIKKLKQIIRLLTLLLGLNFFCFLLI